MLLLALYILLAYWNVIYFYIAPTIKTDPIDWRYQI